MNRDDKAHRFVVTWNAFLDGNRLAYLSLILAIGVDSLVFMSGLFGANALRSPLSDVPSPKARSAHQLEAIIEAALLPDTFNKARLAREAMHPMAHVDGFTNVVRLNELDPESAGTCARRAECRRHHRRRAPVAAPRRSIWCARSCTSSCARSSRRSSSTGRPRPGAAWS